MTSRLGASGHNCFRRRYAPAGWPRTRIHLAPEVSTAQRVDELALGLPTCTWQPFVVMEGSKGLLKVEFATRRVVTHGLVCSAGVADEELPRRDEWLVVRRQLDRKHRRLFYRSSALADTTLTTLARLTAWPGPVESVIEECQSELGLDHYEVRSWIGWHQHTTLTLQAHPFWCACESIAASKRRP